MEQYFLFSIILAFSWALFIALFSIPPIISIAHKKGILDVPNDRTVHSTLIPRMGGLAIFAGFISAVSIFADFTNKYEGLQQLIAGSIVIFFIGLKDDIIPVSAFKKFFVQLLATGIIMFMGGIRVHSFHGFLYVYEISDQFSYVLTFFVIVGITNAVNLIDGLDGLAGSIIVVISCSFGYFFYEAGSVFAVVAFSLAGAVIGFLKFNIKKAKIFMGDTGSLICGFIISVMSIKYLELDTNYEYSPAIAISILVLPIFDTLRVFVMRMFKGKSPFSPDKTHLHHRLLDCGFSQLTVVLIMIAINVGVIALAIIMMPMGVNKSILSITILLLTLMIVLEVCVKTKEAA